MSQTRSGTTARRRRTVDTAVIGGGQAGLVMSWFLAQGGRDHVVLERRERLGGGWQDRWDEFMLVSPNWTASFPGFRYDGDDPDGFMRRDEIAARVARYAEVIGAPVELGAGVRRLSLTPDGFALETDAGRIDAREVVVATGGYHVPRIPAFAAQLPSRLTQLHTHQYRNEAALPPGAVLVVGSGQSGTQIAEELHEAGRRVYLSTGTAGRAPRRYRGRDFFYWMWTLATRGTEFGIGLPTVATLPHPGARFFGNPHLSGHGGGHDMNLRQMARDGITLFGHLDGADADRVRFAPDLAANLVRADRFFDERLRPPIDRLIEVAGLDAGPDDRVVVDFEPEAAAELDLAKAGISTVIWAGGYRLDFGWLELPILDEYGYPRHERGVSEVPGLYFLGLPWLYTQGSAALFGVAGDARYLAERMGLLEGEMAPA